MKKATLAELIHRSVQGEDIEVFYEKNWVPVSKRIQILYCNLENLKSVAEYRIGENPRKALIKDIEKWYNAIGGRSLGDILDKYNITFKATKELMK